MSIIWGFGMLPKKSKSENRREKKLQKTVKEIDKKVRFASSVTTTTKIVRLDWIPELSKKTHISYPIDEYKNICFSWSKTHADCEGEWSWGEPRFWNDDEYLLNIEGHLNNYINNTWNQVESQTYNGAKGFRKLLNKYQSLETLCPEAQSRWLANPILEEFDSLFRFRRGSNKRLWGLRMYHHFYLVWYERKHKICPAAANDR
jgi:hypothetical protein